MEFVINTKDLKKALKEIKRAEKNGFMYCQAVFWFARAGISLSENVAEFTDMLEKAHPTNGNLDWGRGQNVTKRYKFEDGKLKDIKPTK